MNIEKAKSPALSSWREYQSRIATDEEINDWFLNKQYQGLGIVLGTVSKLVVLDIDDPDRAKAFASQFPDLIDTFTIRSGNRQLPHYYYHLPSGLNVAGRCKSGVELRSDGQYVVAPGVRVGNKMWSFINDRMPRTLTKRDLRRILAFMGLAHQSSSPNRVERHSDAILSNSDVESQNTEFALTSNGLIRRYKTLASEVGRNNALFKMSCFARDCGWSESQVKDALVVTHVHQVSTTHHVPETPTQRQHEAYATITSAFSRGARSQLIQPKSTAKQLPNSIREKLLQMGLDNVARVLDGLLIVGCTVAQVLSPSDVYEVLGRFGIGRNTIYEALKATIDDQSIFPPASSPEPPSPDANAVKRFAEETNQCLIGRVAKPGKIRGRKKHQYTMPSIEALCHQLGANVTIGDILPESALASPTAYREALHSALIKRAPRQYSRKWQSERLGVGKDSIRRYEKRLNVIVQAMYRMWELGWHNLQKIMPDEPIAGHFVEDETGKRYPAIVALVRRLLAKGRRLIYKVQLTNFYAMPTDQTNIISHSHEEQQLQTIVKIRHHLSSIPMSPNVTTGDNSDVPCLSFKSMILSESENIVFVESDNTRQQTGNVTTGDNLTTAQKPENISALADLIYQTLHAINPERSITRKNALGLTEQYDEALIRKGLKVIRFKSNLTNPTGFLMTWLRSHKLLSGSVQVDAQKQSPKSYKVPATHAKSAVSQLTESVKDDTHEAWLKRLKASPYLQFISNADQVMEA